MHCPYKAGVAEILRRRREIEEQALLSKRSVGTLGVLDWRRMDNECTRNC